MRDGLTVLGLVASTIWLTLIGWLVGDRLWELRIMKLNEIGDFFAGALGPLALFWFIIAYFLQKKELKQSTKALLLQHQELANSVEQHKQLVDATREQVETERWVLEHERQRSIDMAKPFFVSEGVSASERDTHILFRSNIKNTGSTITNCHLYTDEAISFVPPEISSWVKNDLKQFKWMFRHSLDLKLFYVLRMNYLDSNGNAGISHFSIEFANIEGESPKSRIRYIQDK